MLLLCSTASWACVKSDVFMQSVRETVSVLQPVQKVLKHTVMCHIMHHAYNEVDRR